MSQNMFQSINPYNLELLQEFPEATADEIERAVADADRTYASWRKKSFDDRAKLFKNLSLVLKTDVDRLARIMTLEMGKLFSESQGEILKCAQACEFYAENAAKFLQDQPVATDAANSFIAFQPIGVVLAIMPWNFPFWQVIRFAAPTLMAGNTGILKHSSNVSECAMEIEKMFLKAGFPHGVFKTLLIKSDKIPKMIADPRIKAASLTGSTPAGKSVATEAGKNLKKCVLELGGSDAYAILEDADINLAIKACATSRLINAGQSCVSAKRFIVVEKNYEQFKNGFIEKFKSLKKGDPLEKETQLAPLARKDLRDDLHKQVESAVKNGAKLVLGGKIPMDGLFSKGAFYEPTILENITEQNPAFQEEFFGPVALLFKASNTEEALKIANATSFGLGGGVFSKNIELATQLAKEELLAGSCFVNTFVKSDQRLPFGGMKQSGYGRELSHFGIHEFVNIKTVFVQKT